MTKLPSQAPPPSKAPYVWAVVTLMLISVCMVLGIIALRPAYDVMLVIVGVTGFMAPTLAAVLSFLKAEETHAAVNSRLDAFMEEHGRAQRAEGVAEGTDDERSRSVGRAPTVAAGTVTAVVANETAKAAESIAVAHDAADKAAEVAAVAVKEKAS